MGDFETMDDERFMAMAIEEAKLAAERGEVPVGAVYVHNGSVIAKAHNLRETLQDPSAHAEFMAMREAAKAVGSWRLIDVTCYVTLEPCPMCAGALVNARIPRVVYGCDDPKAGALHSLFQLGSDTRLNHRYEITRGVLREQCAALLSEFIAAIRAGRGKPKP